jgi:charged multivesicular body protein 1
LIAVGVSHSDGFIRKSWKEISKVFFDKMEKQLFNLKFTAKQLERQSKKSTKEEAQDKAKLKKAIQQGNVEGAKIYAANAIRKKNESLNLLRLASRIDATAARVQTAVTMKKVTNNMTQVVRGMEKAMQSMNLETVRNY